VKLIIKRYYKKIKVKYIRAFAKELNLDPKSLKNAYDELKHEYDPSTEVTLWSD
jgi:hypothetical protein